MSKIKPSAPSPAAPAPKTKDWGKELAKLSGVVLNRETNIHDTVLRTGSPAVDFTFGNTWGLPLGATQCLFGPPKGGKSLYCYSMTAQCHKDYPDGHVIKFDTEYRDRGQMTPEKAADMGIDLDRFTVIQASTAEDVFDQIETKVAKMCQDGMPLKLIIIDSVNGIMGRRMANAESVGQQLIGDMAQTLGDGFKRILPVQRKYNFAMVITAQVRAEMDPYEIKRGNKYRMATAYAVQHYAEYFTLIERLKTKAHSVDALGNAFVNEDRKDLGGNADRVAHKILVTMKDSSYGPAGREGMMTFNYSEGLVNQHEELFSLAHARGVFETHGAWYVYGDTKLYKEPMLAKLASEPEFAEQVQKALMAQEKNSRLAAIVTPVNKEGLVVAVGD